jgi:hypothetical protein
MGFLDKLKEGAEQAKDLAATAAERAKDEAKELSLKRQLGNEREALGEKAYSLVEQGAISHPDLESHVAKIRELTAEVESLRADGPGTTDGPGTADGPAEGDG